MLKNTLIDIKIIEKVALALEEINDEVVYVGGAIVSYYATDSGAELPRPTKDIDITVQISSYSEMNELSEKLATKDIHLAIDQNVINRFEYEGIQLDFMPYETTELGQANSWLKPGFNNANQVPAGDQTIKILPVDYYLATKWEAHKSRGGSDPRWSHDFEDIIFVLDNNLEVVEQIKSSDPKLLHFLKEMAIEILDDPSSSENIECHISPFTVVERAPMLIEKLKQIRLM